MGLLEWAGTAVNTGLAGSLRCKEICDQGVGRSFGMISPVNDVTRASEQPIGHVSNSAYGKSKSEQQHDPGASLIPRLFPFDPHAVFELLGE
ncbi:hypothetical protein ES703_62132 [subsurface metagenome]